MWRVRYRRTPRRSTQGSGKDETPEHGGTSTCTSARDSDPARAMGTADA
jgi:hypothetical protein